VPEKAASLPVRARNRTIQVRVPYRYVPPDDTLQAYTNCRSIMGITAFNLILQGAMAAYYQLIIT
jgi:hypothetical protein